jgi:hypothetical protein
MWSVSDESLVAGLAAGDTNATEAFIARFQRRVYGLARAITRDDVLAEDVAQEALLRAWRHASAYDARRGSVVTWLLTITRNLAIDQVGIRGLRYPVMSVVSMVVALERIIKLERAARESSAFEAVLMKESRGSPGHETGPGGCSLPPILNGTCANLSYFNTCSGYIWIFTGTYAGEGHGTRFDGPCVSSNRRVSRGITYFRATVPSYQQTVDVCLDADFNNDGCPDAQI